MRFGPVPVGAAIGGILAHQVRAEGLVLKKGTVVTAAHVAALEAAGVVSLTVARLDPADVPEDEAAHRIARVIAGAGVRVEEAFTGRANLFAERAGVLVVNRAGVDRLNRLDEAITLATLADHAVVEPGEMVATVKIIPYAAPKVGVMVAERAGPLVTVKPFVRPRVAVISTLLPGLAAKVVEKTLAVTGERLKRLDARVVSDIRVPHEAGALADALARVAADAVLVFGASAIADRRDVIPAGLVEAGGRVEHLGMPVDPGNLIMVGSLRGLPVIGAPGCARSPRENGFDWVLPRLLADLAVTKADITGMGVGGLLMEIVSRPQPRAEASPVPMGPITAIILAAGRSSRMGTANKLVATIDGKALVRHVADSVDSARASGHIGDVIVVTGHQADAVEARLAGIDARFVHNPAYAEGLSTSLAAGLTAVAASAGGALVLLGDMPHVGAQVIQAMVEAARQAEGPVIVAPTVEGKRGNPVLWDRRFFAALMQVKGDQGGRQVLVDHAEAVVEVAVDGGGVLLDLDTPEALEKAGGRPGD